MDSRAQSIGISRFFLTLIVGAVAYAIVNEITDPIIPRSQNVTSNATLQQGVTWTTQVIDLMPIMIALLAMLSTIILAVYQREVLR